MVIVNGTAEKVSNLDCCELLGKWKLTAITGRTSLFAFAIIIICAINGCFTDTCDDLCSDPGKITMFVLGFLASCTTFCAWGYEKSKDERRNEHLFQAI